MTSFQPFSLTHLGVVALFAALASLWIGAARAWRGTAAGARLERFVAAVLLITWTTSSGLGLLPGRFSVATELPIQLCDITALLVPLALLVPRRRIFALLYFWGLALSSQGIFTPDLHNGPATLDFWLFWTRHMSIVAGAAYVVIAQAFRPRWRDFALAVKLGLGYCAVVFLLDVAFGFNYGFLGSANPKQRSILDVLGPWPERVLVIAALGCLAMFLLQIPWIVAQRLVERPLAAKT